MNRFFTLASYLYFIQILIMKKIGFSLVMLLLVQISFSQKKPLDHTVYDGWQHIGERMISNNGQWVVYTIEVQEGDNELVIQSSDAKYKITVPRGYNAAITEDSRYVVFKIKPLYKEIREARIKKKKPEEMPKDSLAIVELGRDSVWKKANVSSYKIPQKTAEWVAYLAEKKNSNDKDGAELNLRELATGKETIFKNISEYFFSENGKRLLMYQLKNPKDSLSQTAILYHNPARLVPDTLSRGGAEFKSFAISKDGSQVAYLAQRDSSEKALQKFYKLWYYKEGMDSAVMLADYNSAGMKVGMTISEYGNLSFSKSGRRLFFGTAPIQPPKDTTVPDIDKVSVDIWHYNDDYLQTAQLVRMQQSLRENFLAVFDLETGSIRQLGSKEIPTVYQTDEGDGETFVGVSDFGKRIESQWTGTTKKDIYAIDVNSGASRLVKESLQGIITPSYISPSGKIIMWYDSKAKHYFAWDGKQIRNITAQIKVPLYNEEHDSPSDPPPYGVMGWHEGDSAVYIYDRYDAWRVPIFSKSPPVNFFARSSGRKNKIVTRYLRLDPDERYIQSNKDLLVRRFSEITKGSGLGIFNKSRENQYLPEELPGYSYSTPLKAKSSNVIIYTKENFAESPDLFIVRDTIAANDNPELEGYVILFTDEKLSSINPQQKNYLWGTAELFKWKAYDGKESTGIVYKPENFDPKKKYPVICYFYEQMSNTLHEYYEPAPIRSAVNIPFFVSRGYILFVPDIKYKIGHPGQSAYDYVVSGARALVKKGFADSTRMAIQGHSWGGYQVAYIITKTNLFRAAWAGAPVANMTSAYGGIRWGTGLNRQFQYEKTQSRIGATLWEKRNLYIENSPLFYLDKVKTPLVILHNDDDDAVPWYQGIELFTALRRLGKKVWMFNYNGEKHGLIQRKNRLDYHIRMQQFFDWILKDEKPAKWIMEGVPAVNKGKDMGLELVD